MRRVAAVILNPTRDFSPLEKSRLRRMAAARFLSELGSKAAFAALVLRVAELTPSATALATILTVTVIADAAVTPLAGIIGDARNRRTVMIVSDVAAAVLYLVLGFADNLWLLAALAAVATMAESFYFPASSAALPNMFDKERLGIANATFSQARTAGAVAGPLVAALMFTQVGAGPVFWFNAVTFVLSAVLIAGVNGVFSAPRSAEDTAEVSSEKHLVGFVKVLRDNPIVLTFMAMWLVIQLGTGALWVAIPTLADELGDQTTIYATLLTASTIGSFLGSFLAARILALTTTGKLLIAAMIAEVLLLLGTGTATVVVVSVAALIGFRTAEMAGGAAAYTLFQTAVPDKVRARASAWNDTATIAAFGAGIAIAGPLVDRIGPRYAFAVAAACVAFGILFAIRIIRQAANGTPEESLDDSVENPAAANA